jgi:hypothetical protein
MSTNDGRLYKKYEALCRERVSKNFILRDFLFSVEAAARGRSNYPSDNEEQVIKSAKLLCSQVLEPILEHFGRFAITFGYQARETMDQGLNAADREPKRTSSNPHQWDRGTFGEDIYARVDILPYCVEDKQVTKEKFGRWVMYNLDIDLLMMWKASNVFCITISPKPRRVWQEWVPTGQGDKGGNKIVWMGRDFWNEQYPKLPIAKRPKYHP